jgi:hypothetical protein
VGLIGTTQHAAHAEECHPEGDRGARVSGSLDEQGMNRSHADLPNGSLVSKGKQLPWSSDFLFESGSSGGRTSQNESPIESGMKLLPRVLYSAW